MNVTSDNNRDDKHRRTELPARGTSSKLRRSRSYRPAKNLIHPSINFQRTGGGFSSGECARRGGIHARLLEIILSRVANNFARNAAGVVFSFFRPLASSRVDRCSENSKEYTVSKIILIKCVTYAFSVRLKIASRDRGIFSTRLSLIARQPSLEGFFEQKYFRTDAIYPGKNDFGQGLNLFPCARYKRVFQLRETTESTEQRRPQTSAKIFPVSG